MSEEEAVEPQENQMDEILEQPLEAEQEVDFEEQEAIREKTVQVPLSALQKERKKRQEAELRAEYLERSQQQALKQEPEDDNSEYESATKADLQSYQREAIRTIEERLWIKQNPEKYERINEFLPKFLKERPNLALAINDAPNRYEEAFTLMDALTPKQQQNILKANSQKRVAPNSPNNIPKVAALNDAVDVMSMSDAEFSKWRAEKRKRK